MYTYCDCKPQIDCGVIIGGKKTIQKCDFSMKTRSVSLIKKKKVNGEKRMRRSTTNLTVGSASCTITIVFSIAKRNARGSYIGFMRLYLIDSVAFRSVRKTRCVHTNGCISGKKNVRLKQIASL